LVYIFGHKAPLSNFKKLNENIFEQLLNFDSDPDPDLDLNIETNPD
jgi:hypothetical protein